MSKTQKTGLLKAKDCLQINIVDLFPYWLSVFRACIGKKKKNKKKKKKTTTKPTRTPLESFALPLKELEMLLSC